MSCTFPWKSTVSKCSWLNWSADFECKSRFSEAEENPRMQSSWFVWWWRKGGSRISMERKMEAITKEWKGTFLLRTILGLGPHPWVTTFLTALRELLPTLVTRVLMPTALPALTPCQTLTLISKPLRLQPYLITSCLPSWHGALDSNGHLEMTVIECRRGRISERRCANFSSGLLSLRGIHSFTQ